jgi:hypothetical protein
MSHSYSVSNSPVCFSCLYHWGSLSIKLAHIGPAVKVLCRGFVPKRLSGDIDRFHIGTFESSREFQFCFGKPEDQKSFWNSNRELSCCICHRQGILIYEI